MRINKIKQQVSWLAVAVWMAVIFLLSAQTDKQSGDLSGGIVRWAVALLYQGFEDFSPERQWEILEFWHTVIRKGAHFTEYAILSALAANAIRVYPLSRKLRWLLPVAISAVYAVTDEVHQYFVPGRACSLADVGIDTCGAVFGLWVFSMILILLSKRRK